MSDGELCIPDGGCLIIEEQPIVGTLEFRGDMVVEAMECPGRGTVKIQGMQFICEEPPVELSAGSLAGWLIVVAILAFALGFGVAREQAKLRAAQ